MFRKNVLSGFRLSAAMPYSGTGMSHDQHLIGRTQKGHIPGIFRLSIFSRDAFFRVELFT
jgi:hypothetical protein